MYVHKAEDQHEHPTTDRKLIHILTLTLNNFAGRKGVPVPVSVLSTLPIFSISREDVSLSRCYSLALCAQLWPKMTQLTRSQLKNDKYIANTPRKIYINRKTTNRREKLRIRRMNFKSNTLFHRRVNGMLNVHDDC